ncbi:MAG: hypothetical protein V8R89_06440 [Alphaproteobacteria bacterium]
MKRERKAAAGRRREGEKERRREGEKERRREGEKERRREPLLRIFGVAGKNGVVPLAGDGTKE